MDLAKIIYMATHTQHNSILRRILTVNTFAQRELHRSKTSCRGYIEVTEQITFIYAVTNEILWRISN